MASFSPMSALSSVLLPALGFPNIFTKPDFMYYDVKAVAEKSLTTAYKEVMMEEVIKFISRIAKNKKGSN